MWKLIAVGLGIVGASLLGIGVGDRLAGDDVTERLLVLDQIEGMAERRSATESLAVARLLREGDTDRAFEILDAAIERQRVAMEADRGTPRSHVQDASILKSIMEYQASYPWSPPTPSPEETDFEARFGHLTLHIEGGELTGYRVWNVQPGSVFAQIGVVSGDVITRYDGRSVSTRARPSLPEALQSGSEIALLVRAPDGTVRQVRVPKR